MAMHLEWNVIRLVYVDWTRNVFTELIICLHWTKPKIRNVPVWALPPEIRTTVHALSSRTLLWQWVYWMVSTSVHKRKEKFGRTGIWGSRIFYKHFQCCVDGAEWKRKSLSKEEKSIRYWKDRFMLVLLKIYSLCICHSRNFLSRKQRSENWFCLNNSAEPCRYIFHFHYFFNPRLLFSSSWCRFRPALPSPWAYPGCQRLF